MEQNILKILGVEDKEDVISDLLCHCINASPAFAKAFLSATTRCTGTSYQHICAYPRKRIYDSGVPDIVIKAQEGTFVDIVVVENKLRAQEGKDQTEKYSSTESETKLSELLDSLPPKGGLRHWRYVFLVLFPDQRPKSPRFQRITYQELLPVLQEFSSERSPELERLLRDLVELLLKFYSTARIAPADNVAERLTSGAPLNANYLFFEMLFRELNYPDGVQIDHFRRESWPGRSPFICVISKPAWHFPGDGYYLPSYIHIEPQFDCLQHTFKVLVHFELDPYETQKEAKGNHTEPEISRFRDRQEAFKNYMRDEASHLLKIGGRWNQVGSKELVISKDMTVEQFQRTVSRAIADITEIIDGYVLGAS